MKEIQNITAKGISIISHVLYVKTLVLVSMTCFHY